MIKDKHFFVDLDENDYGAYECANKKSCKLKADKRLSCMQPRVTVTLQKNFEGRAVYTSNGQNLFSVAKLKEA